MLLQKGVLIVLEKNIKANHPPIRSSADIARVIWDQFVEVTVSS